MHQYYGKGREGRQGEEVGREEGKTGGREDKLLTFKDLGFRENFSPSFSLFFSKNTEKLKS